MVATGNQATVHLLQHHQRLEEEALGQDSYVTVTAGGEGERSRTGCQKRVDACVSTCCAPEIYFCGEHEVRSRARGGTPKGATAAGTQQNGAAGASGSPRKPRIIRKRACETCEVCNVQ